METRTLGRTGRKVSVVGLGAWQIGADWGTVQVGDAQDVVRAALDAGITFIDTADVYGNGRSERIIGSVVDHSGVFVATKMGRRVDQRPENYAAANFRAWTDRSRQLLGVDTLDLVQLHCPPDAVFEDDSVFDEVKPRVIDALEDSGGTPEPRAKLQIPDVKRASEGELVEMLASASAIMRRFGLACGARSRSSRAAASSCPGLACASRVSAWSTLFARSYSNAAGTCITPPSGAPQSAPPSPLGGPGSGPRRTHGVDISGAGTTARAWNLRPGTFAAALQR